MDFRILWISKNGPLPPPKKGLLYCCQCMKVENVSSLVHTQDVLGKDAHNSG